MQTNQEINNSLEQLNILEKQIKKMSSFSLLHAGLNITMIQMAKDITAAKSLIKNYRSSLPKFNAPQEVNLQIGGGSRRLEKFVNLDIFEPADIIWDCRLGLPFRNGSFKFIFSEHFLEHIDYPVSVYKVLKEIYRILDKDGAILIAVPDGEKVINAYSKHDKNWLKALHLLYVKRKPRIKINGEIDYINYIFRDQLENLKYTIHYWAYDFESLTNLLKKIGFKKVWRSKFDPSYCNPKRAFYSLYINAQK